jgi:uridine kinase
VTPLEAVAARAATLPRGARIAVDGVSASGKTTFADALAQLLGGDVARVSLDAFLAPPPREVYYPHAFDFAAFRAHLDSLDETVVADGLFLHHPDLRDLWALSVYLHCDASVAMERGVARDASWMENARERYATRYVTEESRYVAEVNPASRADMVIDNTDPERPVLVSDTG